MKALENAEKDNKQHLKLDNQSNAHAQSGAISSEQQAAANIFQAAQPNKSYFSIAIIALVGLVIASLLWFGFQFFQVNKSDSSILMANDLPPKPVSNVNTPIHSVIAHQLEAEENPIIIAENTTDKNIKSAEIKTTVSSDQMKQKMPNKETNQKTKIYKNETKEFVIHQASSADNTLTKETNTSDRFPSDKTIIGEINSDDQTLDQDNTTVKSVPSQQPSNPHHQQTQTIAITKNQPLPRVDETLLSAYNALMTGNMSEAQAKYRQVLHKNISNIDALLGMATIAQKTYRHADAVGWYQKVLEIEPNNAIALAGIVNASPNTNHIAQISRLKNLIASQPTVASFHASLGNLYATQNQWPEAQSAYFNACRYHPNNAEYTFNLAVSLEHLGKPNLALVQYQRALDLVTTAGAASPDRALLSARIAELQ